jgi:hypothetical protein
MEKIIPWGELTPTEKMRALNQYYSIREEEAYAEGEVYDEDIETVKGLLQCCRIFVDREKDTLWVCI